MSIDIYSKIEYNDTHILSKGEENMQYLKSRIHKLYALVGVLNQYISENENPNPSVIKCDISDIMVIVEEILMYDKKFKKTIDKL